LQALEKVYADLTPNLIVLEYHTLDSYGTNETNALFHDYGLIGTPSVVFNGSAGANTIMGPETYETYKERVNQLREQNSTAMITAVANSSGSAIASVSLTNLSASPIENAKLYAIVYEDLKKSENHFIVRDIIPVQSVDLAGNKAASFELKSTFAKSSAVHMVIILKSSKGQFLQAQYVK
jgi:hypothetical protein